MSTTTFSNGVTLTDADWFNDVDAVIYEFLGDGTNEPGTRAAMRDNIFTGGTVTVSTPIISATQTWNAGGVTFTGFKLNVTDTASAAASLLLDLQVGASSKFSVTKAGAATFASTVTVTTGGLTVSAGAVTASGGGSLTGTWTDLGTVTTVDINGGTLDGVTIGGASAAAATVTTLTASGTVTLSGTAANIALGSNYISNGGTDAGLSFDAMNNAIHSANIIHADGKGVGPGTNNSHLGLFATGGAGAIIFYTAGTDYTIAGSGNGSENMRIASGGAITMTNTLGVSGLITANAGLTVASGQTLTLTGATVTGAPTWGSTQTLNTSGTAATVTAAAQAAITSVGTISTDFQPLGSSIPQNSQSANYTTVATDANKHILHPTADNNPRTFTIDSNANVAYKIGTCITFINQINTITIAITADTLTLAGAGSTGSRTLAANGLATAIKVAATNWVISGTGLS